MTRQAVHLIETGRARPSMRSLRVIARRLGAPVTSFLVGSHDEQTATDELRDRLARLIETHQYVEVETLAREALDRKGRPELEATAHYHLGVALYRLYRPAEAIEHLDRAARLFESMGDLWGAAEATEWQASSLYHQDNPKALELGREALSQYRSLTPHRPEVEARMTERVGTYLVRHRAYGEALRYYDQALQVASNVHDLSLLARIYHGQGRCRWSLGDQVTALEQVTKAVMLYRVENDMRPQAARAALPRVENDAAMMHMQRGALDVAEGYLQSAIDHLQETGVERGRGNMLLTLAELRERQGRSDEAMELIERAMELAGRLQEGVTVAAGHRQLAELHAKRGQDDLADLHFRWAIELLERGGMGRRRDEYAAAHRAFLDARTGRAEAPTESA